MSHEYLDKVKELHRRDPEKRDANTPTGALSLMSLALAEGLEQHGEALTRAATASDEYAKHLVQVTGRLSVATWALVLVAAVQIIVTWWRG